MEKAFEIAVENCEAGLDSSVPFLFADTAEPLLKNPDRGFRMESYITLGEPLEAYPTNPEDPYEKLKGFFEKYTEPAFNVATPKPPRAGIISEGASKR